MTPGDLSLCPALFPAASGEEDARNVAKRIRNRRKTRGIFFSSFLPLLGFNLISMAASKLLMVSIVLSLLIVGIRGDVDVEDGTVAEAWDSPMKLEIEQLKSKVAGLGQLGFEHLFESFLKLGFFVVQLVCWLFVLSFASVDERFCGHQGSRSLDLRLRFSLRNA